MPGSSATVSRNPVSQAETCANAVQNRALEIGDLIDDQGEQLPAHVGRRLELLVGARARRAQQVAAVRRLQIDTDRKPFRAIGARLADALEIAARIDFRVL